MKTKGVHDYHTRATRNVKGDSLREKKTIRVWKVENTKAVKISVSVKLSQGIKKIKGCKVLQQIPKTWWREE